MSSTNIHQENLAELGTSMSTKVGRIPLLSQPWAGDILYTIIINTFANQSANGPLGLSSKVSATSPRCPLTFKFGLSAALATSCADDHVQLVAAIMGSVNVSIIVITESVGGTLRLK